MIPAGGMSELGSDESEAKAGYAVIRSVIEGCSRVRSHLFTKAGALSIMYIFARRLLRQMLQVLIAMRRIAKGGVTLPRRYVQL